MIHGRAPVLFLLVAAFFPSCTKGNRETPVSAYQPLLSSPLPAGLSLSGACRAYGTPERPQGHGTLYDFIDGGAGIYLDRGFRLVLRQAYQDASNRTLFAELYVMENRDSALSLFNDPSLRTGGDSAIGIGAKGVAYHPAPDYLIEFYRGLFYARVSSNNDSAAFSVRRLAEMLDQNITGFKP